MEATWKHFSCRTLEHNAAPLLLFLALSIPTPSSSHSSGDCLLQPPGLLRCLWAILSQFCAAVCRMHAQMNRRLYAEACALYARLTPLAFEHLDGAGEHTGARVCFTVGGWQDGVSCLH